MPRKSPYVVDLATEEKVALRAISRKYASPYRDVVRAKIVLVVADGLDNKQIGERLDLPRQIVSKMAKNGFARTAWRGWMTGTDTARVRAFPPKMVLEVKALAYARAGGSRSPAREASTYDAKQERPAA